jgi:hypothetical protein
MALPGRQAAALCSVVLPVCLGPARCQPKLLVPDKLYKQMKD